MLTQPDSYISYHRCLSITRLVATSSSLLTPATTLPVTVFSFLVLFVTAIHFPPLAHPFLSSAGPSFPFLRWPILSFPPLTHHVSPPHFLWEAPTVRFGGQAKTFGGCHRWARGKVRTSFKSLVYSRREAAGCSRFGGRQAKTSGWLLPGKRGVGLSCDLGWVVF
jgi:hypothetical protein